MNALCYAELAFRFPAVHVLVFSFQQLMLDYHILNRTDDADAETMGKLKKDIVRLNNSMKEVLCT